MKQERGTVDPAQMTALLRAGVFAIKPAEVSGELGGDMQGDATVWGAMIEFGHPDVITSLVVLQDGSVSVYLNDGSGVIGCGLHPEVRGVARKMLAIAQGAELHCAPMTQFPSPAPDSVMIYLLTHRGVLGAEVMRHDLDEGAVDLAELYYAAHGASMSWTALHQPAMARGKNVALMTGFRALISGTAVACIALGWLLHIPALIVIAAIIGTGELFETSADVYALRQSERWQSKGRP